MKTLMRTKNDARFEGNGVTLETHLSLDGQGCYDLYIDIEREVGDGITCHEEKTEYMIASTKKEAQKEVTKIARKYCNKKKDSSEAIKVTPKIKARLSHGVDHGMKGKQATGLIVIGQSVDGIEVDPSHFFHAEKVEKINQGQKGFLFSYDIGYRECLERYPEINNQ